MRLFNAQNHSSGYRHPVFLNITSQDCETFEFREQKEDDYGPYYDITPSKNFVRAKNDLRFINFAYAGGVNKCNYDMVKTTDKEGKTYLTFTLAKTTHPSLPSFYDMSDTPLWDFGHAVFKNGSPVINIQLVFSRTGEVESSIFTSLYDLRADGELIMFSSVSEDTGAITYYPPSQVPPSLSGGKPMTIDMAFGYQNPETDIYSRVVKGLRYNVDTVGGISRIIPLCWFLENLGDYMGFIMVHGSAMAWDMNAHSQKYSFSAWYSDETSEAHEYNNKILPGYKGLDI